MVTYLHPFRIVDAEGQARWSATIEEVNQRGWDFTSLHQLVGGVDGGLTPPYHLVVGLDGALAFPPIKELFSVQAAVEFFNRCLAGLLLGGVYCEAINPDGIDTGSIIDWCYIRSSRSGPAAPNRFHNHIRQLQSSPLEAIALVGPRRIELSHLQSAMASGLNMLEDIPLVRGEYLLKGVTGMARIDWGAALANLWIIVEQLVAQIWERRVVFPTLIADPGKSRKNQLMDTRSWSVSNRIELLFQKSVIDLDTLQALSTARRARNDLHHNGRHPSSADAQAAYHGVAGLLILALEGRRPPLLDLDLSDHALIDPFAPPRRISGEPTHWMAIPKLPGEEELERFEGKMLHPASSVPKSSS